MPKAATRSLKLPKSINEKFVSIKEFGNFKRYFGHKFFHSFYSMGIALALNDEEFLTEHLHNFGKNKYNLNPKNENMVNSIDSSQLEHHDVFFKTVAYWILLKQNDPKCHEILRDTNQARKICEEIFIMYWDRFYEYLLDMSTEIPNIYLLKEII
ncbi:MAG: hypothetical protein K9W42_12885 [Candidatus Heimdallarchaeota archaeon]|nr:hypothetical protein [Candidatus Heimdallarchaeota archaeon]